MIDSAKRQAIEAIARQAERIADQASEALGNLAVEFVELGEPAPASVLSIYSAELGDLCYRLRGRIAGPQHG